MIDSPTSPSKFSKETKEFETVHKAYTDGIVVVSSETPVDGCIAYDWPMEHLQAYVSDSSSNVGTATNLRAEEQGWGNTRIVSLTFPVKKDQYWRVNGYCLKKTKMQFFATDYQIIEGTTAKSAGSSYTAEDNGLVTASARSGKCLGPNEPYHLQYIRGYVNNSGTEVLVAEDKSWGDDRAVSITFPVEKDQKWRTEIFCSQDSSTVTFTATNEDYTYESKNFETQYQATTDGYVVSYSKTSDSCKKQGDGLWAYQEINGYTSSSSSTLTSNLAAREIEWGNDRTVSFTFPVSKGEYWKVNRYCTGNPSGLYFVSVPNDMQCVDPADTSEN
jgi:hypothetical protein